MLVVIVTGAVATIHHGCITQSAPLPGAQKNPSPIAAHWQVYTNKFLGYRFEYPSSWVDDSASYNSQRIVEVGSCPANTCEDRQGFMIQVGKREYISDPLPDKWIRSRVSVAGMQADRISRPLGLDDVWVQHHGDWYDLNFFYGTDRSKKQLGDAIFNHILASFKFITPQPLPAPAEFEFLKRIATWTLDSGTGYLDCNDACKEDPGLYRVFRMGTAGTRKPGENNDVDKPYHAVVQTLLAHGWQKCKTMNDEAGTFEETFVKNGKLLAVGRHYSMGAGNSLGITIPTSNQLPQKSQEENNPIVSVTSDWGTFTNKELGFEIRYPPDWKVSRVGEGLGAYGPLTLRLGTKKYGGEALQVMITRADFPPRAKSSPSEYSIGSYRAQESKSESSTIFERCDRSVKLWTKAGRYRYVFVVYTQGLLHDSFRLKDLYQKILSSVIITPVQN